ncbi:hypothetical protein PC123_g13786 [Phytophthora cactorum]|nr:hypothetical protein PC123_g13786 [Phytophthora cactorum]
MRRELKTDEDGIRLSLRGFLHDDVKEEGGMCPSSIAAHRPASDGELLVADCLSGDDELSSAY